MNKIIAVDFDGTLCTNQWPVIGSPIQETIDYILKEQANGAKLILWTCRAGKELTDAIEWSKRQGILFDAVNENLPEVIESFGSDSRKIFADEYIDDQSNPCFTNWPDMGEVSDGYHTFNSLYDQRLVLFAALVNAYPDWAWKSRKHSDGEIPFGGGWFIVGIRTPEGHYTYHYEDKDWDLFHCKELEAAPEWDGHTDKDVRRLLSLAPEPEEGTMSSWAMREIELAIEREKEGSEGTDEWDYGVACYQSAIKAFKTLARDGHSGLSISITKDILDRLIDGLPLTPIEDSDDIWDRVYTGQGVITFQCKRMGRLFKEMDQNGNVCYTDVDRVIGKDRRSGLTFHSKLADQIADERFPITMPYYPSSKKYVVTCEEFLVDPRNGDFDTIGCFDLLTPDGQTIPINQFYAYVEGEGMTIISKDEFEERKAKQVKKHD